MNVVIATGGLGSRQRGFLLPAALRVLGTTADVTEAQNLRISLNPAHCHRIHLQNLWIRDKLVYKLLTIHFFDDVLYIVISEGSAELVVIHGRLVLADPPETSHLLRL